MSTIFYMRKGSAAFPSRRAVLAVSNSHDSTTPYTMATSQGYSEEVTLLLADSKTGYLGVTHNPQTSKSNPYQARVTRDGKKVGLGCFATAEEAALCVARSPEGKEAAKKAAAAPPLTSEESGVVELEAEEAADVLAQIYTSSRKGKG